MKLNVYEKHGYQDDIMTHNFVLVAVLFMHRQRGLRHRIIPQTDVRNFKLTLAQSWKKWLRQR